MEEQRLLFQDLPATAWEQAVFVALFVVFCVAIMGILLRWFSNQQDTWQTFVEKRDEAWLQWLGMMEERVAKALEKNTKALENVAEILTAHDLRVEERISGATNRTTQAVADLKTGPRSDYTPPPPPPPIE